jgi:FdhD protein
MESSLGSNRRRVVSFFPVVDVVTVPREVVGAFDPAYRSFSNINTPGDYFALRGAEQEPAGAIAIPHQISR